MQSLKPWTVEAFNPAKRSENAIHDDSTARRLGFKSGLVPGATLFSYLTHPAVVQWGEMWLDRGSASILLQQPFYEGEKVTVAPKVESAGYVCELRSKPGDVRGTGTFALPESSPPAPMLRGDRPVGDPRERPSASPAALEDLGRKGMGAVRVGWRAEPPYDRYTQYLDDMPPATRPDQRALANPGFVVHLANQALAANVRLGPWIHVETELQNYGRLHLGRAAIVESSVLDVFERGGHQFCDLRVSAFLQDGPPLASMRHRVIYNLRQSG